MQGQERTSMGVRGCFSFYPLFGVVAMLLLLSGCSFWNNYWPDDFEPLPVAEKAQPELRMVWQLVDTTPEEVSQLLKGRGMVTPVYEVMPDNELLPDYIRTAKLFDDLKKAGLNLVSAENTLKWHYKMVMAVEESCPEGATDPLPSCSVRKWYQWLPGLGHDLYDRDIPRQFLEDTRVDYLIISDPAIYSAETVKDLRYAPSSLPLVQMTRKSREKLLVPVQSGVDLAVVRIAHEGRHVESWNQVVASCSLPLAEAGITGRTLRQERERLLDILRNWCLTGVQLVDNTVMLY
ncbi:hypothetical protein [Parendozoicomonas sp. Alg238-R29]|uniref:hypothetical protein n=1 Tax=Parendozoicomonas sp. Alg238-R29 TaxID=2993446 RepID=UPI00248DC350|nr:hypothetical protein [Parendozoicomonas sp. Alg238-R29]